MPAGARASVQIMREHAQPVFQISRLALRFNEFKIINAEEGLNLFLSVGG
jgi:hypothetical protein